MTAIWTPPKTLTRQPQQYVELNPSWVRDSRSLAWLPSSYSRDSGGFSDESERVGIWVVTEGSPQISSTPSGASYYFNGSSRFKTQFRTTGSNTVDAPLMLVARGSTASVASGERYMFGIGAFSRVSELCRIGQSGTALRFQFRSTSNIARNVDAAGAAQTGKDFTIVGLANSDGFYLFSDGVLLASAATTSLGLNCQTAMIGNGTSDAIHFWDGHISMSAMLLGDFSQDSAASVSANPWQLFQEPVNRTIFLPSVVSAVPTLSTPTATATTANSISFSIPVSY